MKASIIASAAIVLALGAGAAHAQTFDFSYTEDSILSETGSLTVQSTATSGVYQIISITGTQDFLFDGSPEAITGLSTALGADNLLYLNGSPFLDTSGLSFTVDGPGADGSGNVNIEYNTYQNAYVSDYELGGGGVFTVTPVGVPEPASLSLAALGLALTTAVRFRKSKQPTLPG